MMLKTKVEIRLGELGHQKWVQGRFAAGWASRTPVGSVWDAGGWSLDAHTFCGR
jgi:hypothetical protein